MSEKKIKPLSQEDQVYSKALIEVLNEKIRQTVRSNLGSDLSSEFEDIVQSVYEAICKQLDDFKNCDNQEALAVTIAARAVICQPRSLTAAWMRSFLHLLPR